VSSLNWEGIHPPPYPVGRCKHINGLYADVMLYFQKLLVYT